MVEKVLGTLQIDFVLSLFGALDSHTDTIEKAFGVRIAAGEQFPPFRKRYAAGVQRRSVLRIQAEYKAGFVSSCGNHSEGEGKLAFQHDPAFVLQVIEVFKRLFQKAGFFLKPEAGRVLRLHIAAEPPCADFEQMVFGFFKHQQGDSAPPIGGHDEQVAVIP